MYEYSALEYRRASMTRTLLRDAQCDAAALLTWNISITFPALKIERKGRREAARRLENRYQAAKCDS